MDERESELPVTTSNSPEVLAVVEFHPRRVSLHRAVLMRYVAYVALFVVLGAGMAYVIAELGETTYGARSEIYHQIDEALPTGFLRQDRTLSTQLVKIQSREVLLPVARAHGLSVDQLSNKLHASVLEDSEVLRIEIDDHSAVRVAKVLVGAITDQYLKTAPSASNGNAQKYLQGQVAALDQQRDQLLQQANQLESARQARAYLAQPQSSRHPRTTSRPNPAAKPPRSTERTRIPPRRHHPRPDPPTPDPRAHQAVPPRQPGVSQTVASGRRGSARRSLRRRRGCDLPRPSPAGAPCRMSARELAAVGEPVALDVGAAPAPRSGHEAAATIGVAGWTLVSRVTGFARVAIIGATLGPTFFANIFQATNTVPNITYNLMAGSLLTTLIVPSLVEALDRESLDRAAPGRAGTARGRDRRLLCRRRRRARVRSAARSSPDARDPRCDPWLAGDGRRAGCCCCSSFPRSCCTGSPPSAWPRRTPGAASRSAAAAPAVENMGLIVTLLLAARWFGTGIGIRGVTPGYLVVLGLGATLSVAAHATLQLFGAARVGLLSWPRVGMARPGRAATCAAQVSDDRNRQARRGVVLRADRRRRDSARWRRRAADRAQLLQPSARAQRPGRRHSSPPAAFTRSGTWATSGGFGRSTTGGSRGSGSSPYRPRPRRCCLRSPISEAFAFGEFRHGRGIELVAVSVSSLGVALIAASTSDFARQALLRGRDQRAPLIGGLALLAITLGGVVVAVTALHGFAILLALGLVTAVGELVRSLIVDHAARKGTPNHGSWRWHTLLRNLGVALVTIGPAALVARVVGDAIAGYLGALAGLGSDRESGCAHTSAFRPRWTRPSSPQCSGAVLAMRRPGPAGGVGRHELQGCPPLVAGPTGVERCCHRWSRGGRRRRCRGTCGSHGSAGAGGAGTVRVRRRAPDLGRISLPRRAAVHRRHRPRGVDPAHAAERGIPGLLDGRRSRRRRLPMSPRRDVARYGSPGSTAPSSCCASLARCGRSSGCSHAVRLPTASDVFWTFMLWRLAALYALFRWVVRTPGAGTALLLDPSCRIRACSRSSRSLQALGHLNLGGVWTPTIKGRHDGAGRRDAPTLRSRPATTSAYSLAVALLLYLRTRGPRLVLGCLIAKSSCSARWAPVSSQRGSPLFLVVASCPSNEGAMRRCPCGSRSRGGPGPWSPGRSISTRTLGIRKRLGRAAELARAHRQPDELLHPTTRGFNWVLGVRPDPVLPAPETWRDAIFLESGVLWFFWVGGIPLFLGFLWLSHAALLHAARLLEPVAMTSVSLRSRSVLHSGDLVLTVIDMHLTLRGGGDLFFVLLGISANRLVPVTSPERDGRRAPPVDPMAWNTLGEERLQ